MKHGHGRTLTTTLAFFAMLFSLALFAYAESGETEHETFRGRIFSEDDIDVSGIEIKVYSSVLTDDDGNGMYLYDEIFVWSVYTDINGYFEFEKPSEICTYDVVMETIPSGYGLNSSFNSLEAGETYDEKELKPVAEVRTEFDQGFITVTLFDADGKVLNAIYEDIPNIGYIKGSIISRDYSVKEYESIKSFDTYVYSGVIKVGDKEFPYSHERDFSDYTVLEKANFLCSVGEITESEKYKCYVEFLNDPNPPHTEMCGTWIESYIEEYKSRTGGYAEIDSANSATPPYDTVYPIVIGNEIVNVCYTASSFSGSDETYLTNFFATVEDIYTYFCIENGFKKPYGPKNSGDANFSTFKIFITDRVGENASGTTKQYSEGASCIWIGETRAKSSLVKQTLSHEFFHAVTLAYKPDGASLWFMESIATMASMVYQYDRSNNIFSSDAMFGYYKSVIQKYTSNYRTSLQQIDPYGVMLYPLCVHQKYGGWSAIEETILNRSAGYSDLGSFGIGGNSAHGYDEKFIGMSVCNVYPEDNYDIVSNSYNMNERWPKISPSSGVVSSNISSTVNPMANMYYQYSAYSNVGTLTFISNADDQVVLTGITKDNASGVQFNNRNKKLIITNFGSENIKKCTVAVTNVGAATASFSIKSSLE